MASNLRCLQAVTARSGERLAFSFLFLLLGALPCIDWLADVVARDGNGFILTGTNAGAESLLETSSRGGPHGFRSCRRTYDPPRRMPRSPSGMTSKSVSIDGS